MNLRTLTSLACFLLTAVSLSASTAPAEKRLTTVVDEVITIANKATTNEALADRVRPVLDRHLSFETMTRRAVGPGWRQFSEQQRREAVDLFATLVIRTYSSKFTIGERPKVAFGTASTTAKGRVEIPTKLHYKGNDYDVTYRLEEAEGWRITDVVAEGVSLVANYRTQLDAQFKRGGPQAVVDSLKNSVDNPK